MKKILFLLFLSFFILFNKVTALTVDISDVINGNFKVDRLNEYHYQYSAYVNISSNEVDNTIITNYTWTFSTSDGNFQNQTPPTKFSDNTNSPIDYTPFATFKTTAGPETINLTVKVTYKDTSDISHTISATKTIKIYALCLDAIMFGPSSVLVCSNNLYEFQVEKYCDCQDWYDLCDHIKFKWTVSPGWLIDGLDYYHAVNIKQNINAPVNNNPLKVNCTIIRVDNYGLNSDSKTLTKTVPIKYPTISISSPSYDICPGNSYTFNLTGNTSGITSVLWSVVNVSNNNPIPGCSITSNGTSATLTLSASNSSVISAKVSAKANYVGGCIANAPNNYILLHTNSVPITPTNSFKLKITKLCTSSDWLSIVEFTYTGPKDQNATINYTERTLTFHNSSQKLNVTIIFTNPCTNVSKSRTFLIQAPECKH